MLIAVITLSVVLSITFYVVWNLLRKVERLEDMSNNLASYIDAVTALIQVSQEKINEIDEKGIYQSDDEVGFFFDNLKEIQNILSTANVNEPITGNSTEEETRS